LVDENGVVRNMNRLGTENFALGNPADWIGRPSLEVFAELIPRLTEDSVERVQSSIDRGDRNFDYSDKGYEIRLSEPDDRTFILYSRPVLSASRLERIGEAWVSWDVTDQRELAARLQHARRMETLGTLAGGVAHDFNNQLTPILGNAEWLANALPDDENRQEAAQDLRGAAEHCAELTRDLLAVAQRTPTQPRPVDVRAIITDVVRLHGASLSSAVDLRVEVDGDMLALRADPTQLKRVVTNLFINARDAVGAEGRIEICARNAVPSSPGDEQRWVALEVRDDGAGMDAETRDHIFDPFFTTKALGRGTGLGLSIVYGIVELHGASIEVESQPGQGTCFRLRWPADEAAVRPERTATSERSALEGSETILLVDDEEGVRRLARRGLELQGYRVIEAEDGVQGLFRYREHAGEIDLAVVDFSMPGRNGIQLIAALREQEPTLPAILVSGYIDRDSLGGPRVEAEFLPKPFRPDQLAALVRETLDRRAD
jgi:two-component system cell cycle sensor histidine kinase/response regulator CckA